MIYTIKQIVQLIKYMGIYQIGNLHWYLNVFKKCDIIDIYISDYVYNKIINWKYIQELFAYLISNYIHSIIFSIKLNILITTLHLFGIFSNHHNSGRLIWEYSQILWEIISYSHTKMKNFPTLSLPLNC